MTDPLIHTENLTKTYGSGETQIHALDRVNLDVAAGEFLAVMGPSGCGKSTLLNMIGALDQPTSGEIWVAGENLAKLKDVDRFRAQTVGFVFQLHNLLPTLTAAENVEVPLQGQSINRKDRRERARHLLALVGMEARKDHLPSQLSGGQRQRIAIARALANQPALILADEPTGALDSQSGEDVLALLAELNQSQQATIVVVTHDRRVAQATGRILRMQDGRVVDDHRVDDPLLEDLRTLAYSRLGQALLNNHDPGLSHLTPWQQAVLRDLLEQTAQDRQPDRSHSTETDSNTVIRWMAETAHG
jgi:ABC-type lipoprotein export system ATPase subunit